MITYYIDSDLNQYRAYDDGPLNLSIDFCSGLIPIATVNISHAGQTTYFPHLTHMDMLAVTIAETTMRLGYPRTGGC